MKKVSYYIILITIIGGLVVAFWLYQKYFKGEEPSLLLFKVERGNIQEVVKVRGEVVPQKEFDLEFFFSGIVEKIFVKEGQEISPSSPLIKLETIDFEIEKTQLETLLAQKQANLEKLIAGATSEDIQVSETKVLNAEIALTEAKKNLADKLQDAFMKSDDAIRSKADQFFNNPRSPDPKLSFSIVDLQLKTDFERERLLIEILLNSWVSSLNQLTISSDLAFYTDAAKKNLNQIKSFLDKAALILSALTTSSNLTQTTIDTYRSDISTARTNINTAVTNLSAAEEKLRTAESSFALARKESDFKKSGTRTEDIEIAKAQIQEIKSQISAVEEKIRKSTLYAPTFARVVKIWFENRELFQPGKTAISLSTIGYKIQADVSELEIGKVREVDGNEVLVELDAFPGQKFSGRVISIEPREIIKEGDKYYRVNVYTEKQELTIRPGMSADLTIHISSKDNTLKIPEFAIYEKDDKKFVKVLEGGSQEEIEIETGISDGEFIEVINGLSEGQTVVVLAD